MKTYIRILPFIAQFFLEWEMFRTNFVEKVEKHFMFNGNFFSFENRAFGKIVWEKYCRSGQATDDNMASARRMPVT